MVRACPTCGGGESDYNEASGYTVCVNCGTVLEESTIVSTVEFSENAGGSSSVVGQFVSATSGKAYTAAGPGYALSRESREIAINNGKRHIQQLAGSLRLSQHYVDAAHRLFILALQRNFIQGRRTTHVVAACLYIVCRREKSAHMLIDFSDALQINLYTLGSTLLKFTRLLSLQLPVIDPSLYIHRFAAKLEFGEMAPTVSRTALRLVQRMKRDWIQTGRRPSGICGACLLIAARVHGFRRTRSDVLRVVGVTDLTLRNRLAEFENTPSSLLSPEEFDKMELADEVDPPAFIRARLMNESENTMLARVQSRLTDDGHYAIIDGVEKPMLLHASGSIPPMTARATSTDSAMPHTGSGVPYGTDPAHRHDAASVAESASDAASQPESEDAGDNTRGFRLGPGLGIGLGEPQLAGLSAQELSARRSQLANKSWGVGKGSRLRSRKQGRGGGQQQVLGPRGRVVHDDGEEGGEGSTSMVLHPTAGDRGYGMVPSHGPAGVGDLGRVTKERPGYMQRRAEADAEMYAELADEMQRALNQLNAGNVDDDGEGGSSVGGGGLEAAAVSGAEAAEADQAAGGGASGPGTSLIVVPDKPVAVVRPSEAPYAMNSGSGVGSRNPFPYVLAVGQGIGNSEVMSAANEDFDGAVPVGEGGGGDGEEEEEGDEEGGEGVEDTLSDIDDEDVDALMLRPEEAEKKNAIWRTLNADYLKEQELRRKEAAENPAAQNQHNSKRKKRKRDPKAGPAASATAATQELLEHRRLSKKINYDALKSIRSLSAADARLSSAGYDDADADDGPTNTVSFDDDDFSAMPPPAAPAARSAVASNPMPGGASAAGGPGGRPVMRGLGVNVMVGKNSGTLAGATGLTKPGLTRSRSGSQVGLTATTDDEW